MTIEKPISTIRKAIKGSAEESALDDFRDTPEQKDFRQAFNFFRYLKIFEPEKYEWIVKTGARGKELKDAVGNELYKMVTQEWEKIINQDSNKLTESIEQIKATSKNYSEVGVYETIHLYELFLKEKATQIKSNSKIIGAFSEKEELLNQTIDFATNSMLELFSLSEKGQNLKLLKGKEAKNLFEKAFQFIRSIG
jgi:hypothetical protein